MKLEDNSNVIEVLLCSAASFQPGINGVCHAFCLPLSVANKAYALHDKAWDGMGSESNYAHASTEAAYRLIESSPTLRAEWFGRSER